MHFLKSAAFRNSKASISERHSLFLEDYSVSDVQWRGEIKFMREVIVNF